MGIVYQTDKRSGITYAYESHSYWDKEKKQSRAKRTLIGRVDKTTGEIVPTDGRCNHRRGNASSGLIKKKQVPVCKATRRFCGATYLLDAIGKELGITEDLKKCFPGTYQQILSLAYYLILEESRALFRFEKWSFLHKHPYDAPISSQGISDLFASITEDAKQSFFTLRGKRKKDKEFWAYDTTSFSSYSQQLRQMQYGHNKEHDPLAQLNLSVVYGASSNLPFYYRKLAGKIPDSKTLRTLLGDLAFLGFDNVKLVMDRGFYSRDNINALYHDHLKFLLSVSMYRKFVRQELDPIYDTFRSFEHYYQEYELYAHSVTTHWDYEWKRPYKGDTIKAKRRVYIHYYFDINRAAEEEKSLYKRLNLLREELLSNQRIKEHEALYVKYFDIKQTPKRGLKVQIKKDVVDKTKRYFGFFALITNEKMDTIQALRLYRNMDVIEKAFGNLKERLNMRRLVVSSEQGLEGKIFVAFVALIFLSHIKKQMQDNGLFKKYTLATLLDQLDLIECFEAPGFRMRVGEMLTKQKEIYAALGVVPPT